MIKLNEKSKGKYNDIITESMLTNVKLSNYTAKITIPTSIPNDDKIHEATIRMDNMNCRYIYSATPKLSDKVYLVAEIPNWSKYNFQYGKMAIYLKNTYLGDSYMKSESMNDTIGISVGTDNDISIKREEIQSLSSSNIIGTNKSEQKTWKITVKNNKDVAVEINVEDNYPISTDEDIKVELVENGNANVNEEAGFLNWKLKLKPNEKKEIKFSYIVRYPKKRNITVE